MSKRAREFRSIRRAGMNPQVLERRNRKAEREYDNWLRSQIVITRVELNGYVWWTLVRTGRGLIHKGRKP